MAWISAAIAVGGALLSNNSASKDRGAASAAEANALAFEQQRYDDWKAIYGPMQQNLSDYYSGLSADQYEVQGLEAFELEKEAGMKSLRENLAQRGISDSGLSAATEVASEMSSIQNRATIRQEAPGKVAAQKLGFLQVGLGQNPADNLSNIQQDQVAGRRSRANESSRVAGQATGDALTALGDYAHDRWGNNG